MIVLRAYATWIVVAVTLAIAVAYNLSDPAEFAEGTRWLGLALALMLVVAFAPAAKDPFFTPGWPKRPQSLALASWIFGLFTAAGMAVSLFFRLADKPRWLLEAFVINAWMVGAIVQCVVYIVAPGFLGADVKVRDKRWILGLWIAIGITVGTAWFVRPNAKPLADWIETQWIRPSP